jgi:putative ABC transport system permease protein
MRRPQSFADRVERLARMIPLRLRTLFRHGAVEADLDEELRFHVEEHARLLESRGFEPAAARREALRQFGGVERRKDEARERRGMSWLDHLVRDIRLATRALRHAPAFTAVAIVTLGLGIGANTAIFTVVNAVLFRPLEYADPSRLVLLQEGPYTTVAPANFLDWRDQTQSLSQVGAAEYWTPTISGSGPPEKVMALHVSAEILPMMGVAPALGRVPRPEEDHDGSNHVVVLRHDTWLARFAGDSAVLGRTLTLDGEAYTIIGVMPAGFRFAPFWATEAGMWAPLSLDRRKDDRRGASLRVFARLKPGVTIAQAEADFAGLARRLDRLYPGTNPEGKVMPLQEVVTGDVRTALLILLAAVGLVLLIACANVAHLQLMRAATRQREFAVRTALGATRARLVQQSLVESLLLALGGSALGLLLAEGGIRALVALAPGSLPRLDEIHLDGGVFAFLLVVAVLAGLVFGIAPAAAAARVDPQGSLKEGGRTVGDSRARGRLRAALVISEFAMALMLLLGAGLVLRSFLGLLRVDPGFDPRQTLSMVVSLRGTDAGAPDRRVPFFDQLVERVRQLPGVEAASAVNHLPLHGDHWNFHYFVEGQPLPPPGQGPGAQFLVARPGYFATLRARLVQGREFSDEDERLGSKVVVINDVMAAHGWPGADPVGRRIDLNGEPPADWYTIIGVVRDVRTSTWSGPPVDEMYFVHSQAPDSAKGIATALSPAEMTLVVRASGDPATLTRSIRGIVSDLDADAPVSDVITLDAAIGEQLAAPKFYLFLLGLFAAVAITLAAIGVYGVISYSVAQRTHEIGVRMALGAGEREARGLVIRQGLALAGLGGAIGLVGALVATRALRTLLYGVGPADPITFVVGVVVLVLVALAASAIPARRAARIDPLVAIRQE